MTTHLKTILKLVVSIGMLSAMLYFADIGEVATTISNAEPLYICIAFMLILVGSLFAGYRWHTVMHQLDFGGSVGFYLKSYMKGIFFNQLLPSSIGGDAVRILDVSALGYKKRYAFVGVLIDRGLGIFGIFLVNIVFLNIYKSILPQALTNLLNLICVVGIVGFFAFALLHKFKFIEKLNFLSFLILPSQSLYTVIRSVKRFLIQSAMTVSVHMLTFAGVYFIAYSLGEVLPIQTFMVIMPPVILLTIIPISLAGWGIREGAMVGLLAFANVSSSVAVSISILFGFSYIIQGLVGLFFWAISNKKEEK